MAMLRQSSAFKEVFSKSQRRERRLKASMPIRLTPMKKTNVGAEE